jgi:4-hydroxy-tetrahydrodipicolinate synthase
VILSGDDAITLPLFALGGRGVISVASNEIPAEIASLCNFALQNNFAAARAIHSHYLSLMEINFVESNPIPVKAAMAKMGLLQPVWRLPLVAPSAGSLGRIHSVLETLALIEKTYAAVGD